MLISARAELLRTLTRGHVALLAVLVALAAFSIANAGPQGNAPIQGFRDVSIFLATSLMGRAATAAASDYRTGTLRPWLISRPRRGQLFAGKLAASVTVAVVAAAVLVILAWPLTALFGHPATASTLAGCAGSFLLACIALTLFGHAVGLITRSVPAALAITLGWILPAEAVLSGSLDHPDHWLPGLLLRSVTDGVTPAGLTTAGVVARALLPFVALEALALLTFLKRDVRC